MFHLFTKTVWIITTVSVIYSIICIIVILKADEIHILFLISCSVKASYFVKFNLCIATPAVQCTVCAYAGTRALATPRTRCSWSGTTTTTWTPTSPWPSSLCTHLWWYRLASLTHIPSFCASNRMLKGTVQQVFFTHRGLISWVRFVDLKFE